MNSLTPSLAVRTHTWTQASLPAHDNGELCHIAMSASVLQDRFSFLKRVRSIFVLDLFGLFYCPGHLGFYFPSAQKGQKCDLKTRLSFMTLETRRDSLWLLWNIQKVLFTKHSYTPNLKFSVYGTYCPRLQNKRFGHLLRSLTHALSCTNRNYLLEREKKPILKKTSVRDSKIRDSPLIQINVPDKRRINDKTVLCINNEYENSIQNTFYNIILCKYVV